jgi:DNA-directed RNA polymerase beta subunit
LKTEVEIFPLIKYLGVTDKEIFESLEKINLKSKISLLTVIDKWLNVDLEKVLVEIWSKNQSEEYGLKRLQEIIDNYLLPTFGSDQASRLRKGEFLLKMLLSHLNTPLDKNLDYKDFLSLKRLKTVGELFDQKIGLLLDKAFLDFGENITKKLKKKTQVFQALFKTSKVTSGLISSISTGTWVGSRAGLNQIVERNNTVTTLSGLRKVINSTSKLARGNIRDVNPSYWGRFCPVETSLSTTCGLLKFLAVGAKISTVRDNEQLLETINKELEITSDKNYESMENGYLVKYNSTSLYVDGKKYLIKESLNSILQKLRLLKRKLDYSLYVEENQIFVDSSLGRISRPLLILPTAEKQRKDLYNYYSAYTNETIEGLIKKGILEYLEYSEEKNSSFSI